MAKKRAGTKKTTKVEKKATVVALSAAQVPKVVEKMAAASGADRFAAGKALCVTAEKDPSRVYPYFDVIAGLLASKSKVITWNAMRLIALMAAVDADRKVDALLDRYLAFIGGDNLISAANAIGGAGLIARARPDLVDRIVPAILAVAKAKYETDECRNVAIGQALDALAGIGLDVCRRPEVAKFVRRQRTNTRAAVAKRAGEMVAELALGA